MQIAPFASRRTILALSVALFLGGAAAHGQRPQGGGAPATLTVDFTALAADGKPVTDLTPADVTVRIAGKNRTVSALEFKAASGAGGGTAGLTPPFFTNEPVTGRSFQIIVDVDSLPAGREPDVRTAIEGLLKNLTGSDRVAFSVAPRDTAQIPLTSDFERVRTAVNDFKAQRPGSVSTAEALCRSRDSLVFLQGMMEQFTGNAAPTSVIFIAASLSTPGQASSSTAGSCEVTKDHYQAIADTAAEARATLYVVQGDSAAMGRNDGLENLAGVAEAGQVLRVVNDGFAPQVLAESAGYWVATLAPDPSDRQGQVQRLEVRAAKEGVTIRARPEFAIPRAGAGGASGGATAKDTKEMMGTTAAFTDLQLRALAYAARGQADKMNVLVLTEPVDPTVKITSMRVGFFDASNKGGSLEAPQLATFPITTPLPLGIGQYRIRVAAMDSNGRKGAVDLQINTAPTEAGPLKLSTMLLGAGDAQGSMHPKVTFGAEENVLAYLEMYGQITGGISVKFELAETDKGPAIGTFQASGGATNEPDKFALQGEIPIAKLAPGDYVIRALVQLEGSPEGRVLRTFRKLAK